MRGIFLQVKAQNAVDLNKSTDILKRRYVISRTPKWILFFVFAARDPAPYYPADAGPGLFSMGVRSAALHTPTFIYREYSDFKSFIHPIIRDCLNQYNRNFKKRK